MAARRPKRNMWGRLACARRSRRGSPISRIERQLAAKTSEAYERDVSQFLALPRRPSQPPARHAPAAARCKRATCAPSSPRGGAKGWAAAACRARCRRSACSTLPRAAGLRQERCDARRGALPKLPHSVPKPLTAPKATALVDGADIASPDAAEWIVARDTAVLALLYGSGLRISEALSLARKDAPIKGRDMLRVTGKGDKTRVVPVLPIVREAVERYLALCPMTLGSDDPLFVGARGRQLSPRIIQLLIAQARARARAAGDGDAACAPPLLRHASARRRRGSARDPGAARPREPLDHARLYRGRPRASAEDLRPRPSPRLSGCSAWCRPDSGQSRTLLLPSLHQVTSPLFAYLRY